MISHARFLKLGLDTNVIVATRLLNEYVSSQNPNSLFDAHNLFNQVPFKDTVLWTSIISAYTRSGNSEKALQLFSQMHRQNHTIQPNHFVYATIARACGTELKNLNLGKSIHTLVIKSGFMSNVVVGTAFLDMYAKCGVLEHSQRLFDEMPQRNLISWNALIAGYVLHGMGFYGLELFYQMKCVEFLVPDEFTVATVLMACAGINDLKFGMQVHGYIVCIGFEIDCENVVCNMYFRCGEVSSAERVLKGREDDARSKLIMLRGYVFNERYQNAILYVACKSNFMEIVGVDHSVFVSILTACANLSLLRLGRQVHSLVITSLNSPKSCLSKEEKVIIGSALIDMYCKCFNVSEARRVFDGFLVPVQYVSLWNSLITGYMYNGFHENAKSFFEEMPERNVVSWTTMISGYVQCGLPEDGLRLLTKMYIYEDDVAKQGSCFTFVIALEACSHLTALKLGNQIHAKLIRTVVKADIDNIIVGTALVDMYTKSGDLNYAKKVFDRMVDKNVVSWTSMITGYAIHGFGYQALQIFEQMMEVGINPNEVTFVSILTACSHCGLVKEGMQYFKLMKNKYRMVPRVDHFTCVIDMLGRAGRLDDAYKLLEEIEDGGGGDLIYCDSIWGALLGACMVHGDVEMGRRVGEKMLKKRQQVSKTYVTLSNIYAAAGMWDKVYGVRERWRREGAVVGGSGSSRIHVHLGTS